MSLCKMHENPETRHQTHGHLCFPSV
uniref:Uncharacterized protein n=1 Tax=Arundo donax TaxID=35708 RepID=A0A0A8YXX1_ARUDO